MSAYSMLIAGYLIGASIYAGGLLSMLAITSSVYGFWPWQVSWRWTGLVYLAWPFVVQLLPFALLAAAVIAARSLNRGRFVTAVVLASTVVVIAVNVAVLGGWLVSEIGYANRLVDFHRSHPNTLVDRFDGGMPGTAMYATAKTMIVSLVAIFACIVTAIFVRFMRSKSARGAIAAI